MNMTKGQIISYKTKDGTRRYRAIFDRREGKILYVSGFVVHRTKTPSLKCNEGHGGPAGLWAPNYTTPRVLKTKSL